MTQHRGVVVAKKGMVAASQPLAVSAGLNVLQRGGTFVDAALATSATLAVVEPSASHIGGDAFVIVYDAKTGTDNRAQRQRGRAPHAPRWSISRAAFPCAALAAASVPGLVDTWFALHGEWGRLPVTELLAPAIAYAEEGFPLGYRMARICRRVTRPLLRQHSPTASRIWLPTIPPPRPGQIHAPARTRLDAAPDRARMDATPSTTAPSPRRVLEYSRGEWRLVPARRFRRRIRRRLPSRSATAYRGYTVHGQPPVSQGHILLQELNLVEGFDLSRHGPQQRGRHSCSGGGQETGLRRPRRVSGRPEFRHRADRNAALQSLCRPAPLTT